MEDIATLSFPLFVLKLEYLADLSICDINCRKLPKDYKSFVMLLDSICNLKKLRTLEVLMSHDLMSSPQFIAKRITVTYQVHMSLSRGKVTILPKCIAFMENLECLELENRHELVELPKGMVNLKGLKCCSSAVVTNFAACHLGLDKQLI
uniref:Uncharacterized protein n=1 Tax=Oryza punctata TaxID=4537 RepID=A0A0E0MJ37_ORYPU